MDKGEVIVCLYTCEYVCLRVYTRVDAHVWWWFWVCRKTRNLPTVALKRHYICFFTTRPISQFIPRDHYEVEQETPHCFSPSCPKHLPLRVRGEACKRWTGHLETPHRLLFVNVCFVRYFRKNDCKSVRVVSRCRVKGLRRLEPPPWTCRWTVVSGCWVRDESDHKHARPGGTRNPETNPSPPLPRHLTSSVWVVACPTHTWRHTSGLWVEK